MGDSPLVAILPELRQNFSSIFSELNLNNFADFEQKFTHFFAETNQTTPSHSEVVRKLISLLHPKPANKENDILRGLAEKKSVRSSLRFALLRTLFQHVNEAQQLNERFHIFDEIDFDFCTLLDWTLSHLESAFALDTVIEFLSLICKFYPTIFEYAKIVDIFRVICHVDDDPHRSALMLNLLNLAAANRNLFCFHECFITATNDINGRDMPSFGHEFEHTYAQKIFDLSSTNVALKIWKLFLDNFAYSRYGQLSLFAIFLAHQKPLQWRLNESNRVSFDQLLQRTAESIHDFDTSNERVLPIYHSLLCVKFLLHSEDKFANVPELHESLFDLSDLFTQTTAVQWENVYQNFDELYDDRKRALMKLILVKYKLIRLIDIARGGDRTDQVFRKSLSRTFLPLLSSSSDNRIVSICPEIVPPLLADADHELASELMDRLFDALFRSPAEDSNNTSIFAIFSQPSVWESGPLQSVFVTAFLKRIIRYTSSASELHSLKRKSIENDHSVTSIDQQQQQPLIQFLRQLTSREKLWAKHFAFVPDSKHENEKVFNLIKSGCDHFSETFIAAPSSRSSTMPVANAKACIQLLTFFADYVPLEHLHPLNQLRTILATSALLWTTAIDESRSKLCEIFSRINLRIWNSFRSIWLFDLLPPHRYIAAILFRLQSNLDDRCYALFNAYVANLFRSFDCDQSYTNVCALIDELSGTVPEDNNDRDREPIAKIEYILMAQTMILRNNAQFVKRLTHNEKISQHLPRFEQIGKRISSLIYTNIKLYLNDSDTIIDRHDSEFVVEGLTKLFQHKVISSLDGDTTTTLKNKWRKLLIRFVAISLDSLDTGSIVNGAEAKTKSFINFLQVIVQNRAKLEAILPENFLLDVWSKIMKFDFDADTIEADEQSSSIIVKKVRSTSYWLKIYRDPKVYHKFIKLTQSNCRSDGNWSQRFAPYRTLLNAIEPLLVPIAESSTADEFEQIITDCIDAICRSTAGDFALAAYYLSIYRRLIAFDGPNLDREKCLRIADDRRFGDTQCALINIAMRCAKSDCANDRTIQTEVRLAGLELSRELFRRAIAVNRLTHSHLFAVYNLATESGLVQAAKNVEPSTTMMQHDSRLFCAIFSCLTGIISDLLTRKPHLAVYTSCPLLNMITTMIVSLLTAADERRLTNATDQAKLSIENCAKCFAQNVLTVLSRLEDFEPYALQLIAHYLHHLPHYSVAEFVKKNLTVGVFNLLSMVKQRETIERLHTKLGQSSRELFRILLEHHEKYHRFKGYV